MQSHPAPTLNDFEQIGRIPKYFFTHYACQRTRFRVVGYQADPQSCRIALFTEQTYRALILPPMPHRLYLKILAGLQSLNGFAILRGYDQTVDATYELTQAGLAEQVPSRIAPPYTLQQVRAWNRYYHERLAEYKTMLQEYDLAIAYIPLAREVEEWFHYHNIPMERHLRHAWQILEDRYLELQMHYAMY
jgi:hypothetical protein